MSNSTITDVVQNGLCNGCGTCAGICPVEGCISVLRDDAKGVYNYTIDSNKCIRCGVCHAVCPGGTTHTLEYYKSGLSRYKHDRVLGYYRNCYIGNSTDENIRFNSASGGLVSTVLINLLDEGLITGAIITRYKKNNPLEAESYIARTKEEIISASGSKYLPISMNEILKEIMHTEGRFAFVGLPCQIEGIRNVQKVKPVFREKIAYMFGLFCSHVSSFYATELLLEKMKIDKKNVEKIKYRGEGHPGKMRIELKNGNVVTVNHKSRLYWGHHFYRFFWNKRCWLCTDHSSELADISFADNWNTARKLERPDAASLMVVRTRKLDEFIKKWVSEIKIDLFEVGGYETIKAQSLDKKKGYIGEKIYLLKLFRHKVPTYQQEYLPFSMKRFLVVLPELCRLLVTIKKRNPCIVSCVLNIDAVYFRITRVLGLLYVAIVNPQKTVAFIKKGYLKKYFINRHG